MAAGGTVLAARPLSLVGALGPAAPGTPGGSISEKPLAPRAGRRGATLFKELAAGDTGVVTENAYDDPRMWGSPLQRE